MCVCVCVRNSTYGRTKLQVPFHGLCILGSVIWLLEQASLILSYVLRYLVNNHHVVTFLAHPHQLCMLCLQGNLNIDTRTHRLTICTHPIVHGLMIVRHDQAVWHIHKTYTSDGSKSMQQWISTAPKESHHGYSHACASPRHANAHQNSLPILMQKISYFMKTHQYSPCPEHVSP